MRNRSQRLFLSGAVLLCSAVPLAAQAADSPPSEAASVAAKAGDVVSISDTEAHAAADKSTSRASVVRVAGNDVANTGGHTESDGQGSGQLAETAPSDVLEAQVAPWEVSAKKGPDERTSHSRATLARLRILKSLQVALLDAESNASHRSDQSTGSAQTDAAHLTLTDKLDLILLRSEVQSDGRASSYLVGLNGIEIGTDEQLGSVCAVSAAPLIQLACLLAKGGVAPADGAAPSTASAAVGDAGTAVLSPVKAFSSAALRGRGAAAAPAGTVANAPLPAPAAATAAIGSTEVTRPLVLPRTGAMAGLLAFAGLGLLGLGLIARRVGRGVGA